MKLKLFFPFYDKQKIMFIYYSFNQKNAFIMYSQNITPLMALIISSRYVINKNHILKHLSKFKKSIQKLLSKIAFNVGKKTKMIYYVFNQKDNFLYILFKMKALNGIIMPETYFMFLNHRLQINFYFKIR